MEFKSEIVAENKRYDLNYSVSQLEDNSVSLSVTKELEGKIVDKSTVILAPISFSEIVKFVGVMCENTVTPTSFRDIVEDMIVDKMIVA